MNGNMTHDGMRGVDLEYNSLNLVSKVKQGNTANATYRWLADGTKAGVTDNDGNGFEYLGSFVYVRDASGLNLESTSFGAGRFVALSTGEMTPYYHITDHLGSVRVVYDSPNAVLAHNDYYAFGLKHENPNLANHTSNRYLYNGKEEQTTGGVDLLDYGARMYDATLGRFNGLDNLSEKRFGISAYVYCSNNPVNRIDLDGNDDFVFGKDGKFVRVVPTKNRDVIVHQTYDANNKMVENRYQFVDSKNDPTAIRDGKIDRIVFVSETQVERMMENAGAFDSANKDSWRYMYNESHGTGKLDFSYSQIPNEFPGHVSHDPVQEENAPSPTLFIIEGTNFAQNHMNFGNFLWGAAGHTLGFSAYVLTQAAHFNSLFNPGRGNGYRMQYDSDDDQLSIGLGIKYAIDNYFRKRYGYEKN